MSGETVIILDTGTIFEMMRGDEGSGKILNERAKMFTEGQKIGKQTCQLSFIILKIF